LSFSTNIQHVKTPHITPGMGSTQAVSGTNNKAVVGTSSGSGSNMSTTTTQTMEPAPTQEKKKQGCGGAGDMMTFGLLGVMLVVFYFFLIRPQKKQQEKHQSMLNQLVKGDKVVTSGGILGVIVTLNDKYATIEIADKTRIRIIRSFISRKQLLGGDAGSQSSDSSNKNSDKKIKRNKRNKAKS
jgi:preprotein translocase subunit YajC